jgi:predicted dehydrogenase
LQDFKKITDAYNKHKNVVVAFGYNHRYHPAPMKAKQLIDSGKYGKVLFIRAKYGHGARLGYEKEWRFDKEISGGGHLLDQGTHLIDFVNFFAGNLDFRHGHLNTLFWDTKLEDSAFLLLEKDKTVASLSTTCLEWKNVFCFEIMLKTAKIQIDGLGRSYGAEKLTVYEMSKKMGPPKVKEFNFPGDDFSWILENKAFFAKIKNADYGDTSLKEAKYVLDIINETYKKQK